MCAPSPPDMQHRTRRQHGSVLPAPLRCLVAGNGRALDPSGHAGGRNQTALARSCCNVAALCDRSCVHQRRPRAAHGRTHDHPAGEGGALQPRAQQQLTAGQARCQGTADGPRLVPVRRGSVPSSVPVPSVLTQPVVHVMRRRGDPLQHKPRTADGKSREVCDTSGLKVPSPKRLIQHDA
jgi:hypothetical protein